MAKTKNESAGTYANDIHDDSVYIVLIPNFKVFNDEASKDKVIERAKQKQLPKA